MRKTSTADASHGTQEGSGPHVIPDPPAAALSGNDRANVGGAVESIQALTSDELQTVAALEVELRAPLQSGAFAKDAEGRELGFAALAQGRELGAFSRAGALPPTAAEDLARDALRACYGELPPAPERAEIRVDDLSLALDNPFLPSSLSPPPVPKHRVPWRALGLGAAALALMTVGYLTALVFAPDSRASLVTDASGAAPSAVRPETALALTLQPANSALATAGDSVQSAPPGAPAEAAAAPPAPVAVSEPLASFSAPGVHTLPVQPLVAPVAAAINPSTAGPVRAAHSSPTPAPVSAKARSVTRAAAAAFADPAVALPAKPARTDVQRGIESVRPSLEACADGAHGQATASITISGAGRVTYALIEGAFAGTPQGSCMARALRSAQFPRFTEPHLRVSYPFVF